jgi:hypothetical protein
VEVTGYAVNLEPVLPSFGINGLTVDAAEIEVAGFVTDFFSTSGFTAGNQPVQIGEDTLFVDGTQADVALGI